MNEMKTLKGWPFEPQDVHPEDIGDGPGPAHPG